MITYMNNTPTVVKCQVDMVKMSSEDAFDYLCKELTDTSYTCDGSANIEAMQAYILEHEDECFYFSPMAHGYKDSIFIIKPADIMYPTVGPEITPIYEEIHMQSLISVYCIVTYPLPVVLAVDRASEVCTANVMAHPELYKQCICNVCGRTLYYRAYASDSISLPNALPITRCAFCSEMSKYVEN